MFENKFIIIFIVSLIITAHSNGFNTYSVGQSYGITDAEHYYEVQYQGFIDFLLYDGLLYENITIQSDISYCFEVSINGVSIFVPYTCVESLGFILYCMGDYNFLSMNITDTSNNRSTSLILHDVKDFFLTSSGTLKGVGLNQNGFYIYEGINISSNYPKCIFGMNNSLVCSNTASLLYSIPLDIQSWYGIYSNGTTLGDINILSDSLTLSFFNMTVNNKIGFIIIYWVLNVVQITINSTRFEFDHQGCFNISSFISCVYFNDKRLFVTVGDEKQDLFDCITQVSQLLNPMIIYINEFHQNNPQIISFVNNILQFDVP